MALLRGQTGRILVESHRGADKIAPGNSWAGILAGAEAGADWIEVDVQITADGIPILYHPYRLPDGAMVRTIPHGQFLHLDAGDGQPPPRLDEVLDWARTQGANLTLDIKNGFGMGVTTFAAVLEVVNRTETTQQVMVAAYDHIGLLWVKRHQPQLYTRALLRGSPIDLVAMAKRAEVDAVALSYDLIEGSDVEALHEEGIAVMLADLWEPNFRYPVTLGVDMISWGDPAEAIFALEQQRGGN